MAWYYHRKSKDTMKSEFSAMRIFLQGLDHRSLHCSRFFESWAPGSPLNVGGYFSGDPPATRNCWTGTPACRQILLAKATGRLKYHQWIPLRVVDIHTTEIYYVSTDRENQEEKLGNNSYHSFVKKIIPKIKPTNEAKMQHAKTMDSVKNQR